MKKYLLGLIAVVLAVGLNAFTAKKAIPKQTVRYAVYNLAVPVGETTGSNYTILTTQPSSCPNMGMVCWFRFTDLNGDGVLNSADVAIRADQLDTDNDFIINDNQVEAAGLYEEQQ